MKNSHIVTLILSLVFISMASSEAGAQEITVPEGLTVTLHGEPLTGGTHRISRIKN